MALTTPASRLAARLAGLTSSHGQRFNTHPPHLAGSHGHSAHTPSPRPGHPVGEPDKHAAAADVGPVRRQASRIAGDRGDDRYAGRDPGVGCVV